MTYYAIIKNGKQIGFTFGQYKGAYFMFNAIFEYKQQLYNNITRTTDSEFFIPDTQEKYQLVSCC